MEWAQVLTIKSLADSCLFSGGELRCLGCVDNDRVYWRHCLHAPRYFWFYRIVADVVTLLLDVCTLCDMQGTNTQHTPPEFAGMDCLDAVLPLWTWVWARKGAVKQIPESIFNGRKSRDPPSVIDNAPFAT